MAAPLIGVTANYQTDGAKFGTVSVGESYIQAVIQAGGLPVVIPVGLSDEQINALFARLDGLLLTGGADVDPQRFGGQPHPRVYGIDARRDNLEVQLAQMAAQQDKPFLGICRGVQVINVALGGSLFTDIGDQLPEALRHDWYPDIPRDYLAHTVQVQPESRLARILEETEVPVNSLHHQGIQRAAESLRPTAYAPDGLLEAVELPDHRFGLGVQWHPEWIQEQAAQRRLFKALIEAAHSARQ